MVNVLVAHTFELDDAESAITEILEQLDIENALRKNSVGLVACHAEFLYSGIVAALSEKLPFDLVGITTLASAVNGAMGVDILTLSVLTSDEVTFSTALTASLAEDQLGPLEAAYAEAAGRLPEKPSFGIVYGPQMEAIGGDVFVVELNRLADGAPLFGTLTCDHTIDFSESYVFRNGEYARDVLSMVLASGPVKPEFFFISISEEKIPKQKGVITSSEGNVVHTINDMPAMEYFAAIGLTENHFAVNGAIPMTVDYLDGGPPVGRGIYMTRPNGDVILGGEAPEKGIIAPAFLDVDEVMSSAALILEKVKKAGSGKGMLVMSCLSRSLVLAAEPLREAELVSEMLGHSQPFQLLYSAGEICPIYADEGKSINRFHNFTLTVCLF